jgi:hypothetical protein
MVRCLALPCMCRTTDPSRTQRPRTRRRRSTSPRTHTWRTRSCARTPSYTRTYTERRAQFTIDPDSGALSATWTNPDMTCMPVLLPRPAPADPSARADSPLVAVVDGPNFFWVGNVADYNAASGADAMPVVSAPPQRALAQHTDRARRRSCSSSNRVAGAWMCLLSEDSCSFFVGLPSRRGSSPRRAGNAACALSLLEHALFKLKVYLSRPTSLSDVCQTYTDVQRLLARVLAVTAKYSVPRELRTWHHHRTIRPPLVINTHVTSTAFR